MIWQTINSILRGVHDSHVISNMAGNVWTEITLISLCSACNIDNMGRISKTSQASTLVVHLPASQFSHNSYTQRLRYE